jgi:hypothetical protein
MKTVNTISGGKSSATNAILNPADYNVFSLVRIERPQITESRFDVRWMKGQDEKTRQVVSDRLGLDFYGTAEDDTIIYTILDLEQVLGQEIKIISGETFDHVLQHSGRCLPDPLRRFCTEEMKLKPMFNWWKENINEPAEFRIGFRKGEENRAVKLISKLNENGFLEMKAVIGSRVCKRKKTGEDFIQNRWGQVEWQKPSFKLIDSLITRDYVNEFVKKYSIRFSDKNNCGNCMHADPLYMAHRARNNENIREVLKWAGSKEGVKHKKDLWFKEKQITMSQILNFSEQYTFLDDITDSDFNDCDSGYCGV